MCMLCSELARKNLNIKEIARAYIEMQTPEDMEHYWELLKNINTNYDLNEVMRTIRALEDGSED